MNCNFSREQWLPSFYFIAPPLRLLVFLSELLEALGHAASDIHILLRLRSLTRINVCLKIPYLAPLKALFLCHLKIKVDKKKIHEEIFL